MAIPAEPEIIPAKQSALLKSRIDDGCYPIYLFGPTGAGKSSAAAVAVRCFAHKESGHYVEADRITGLEKHIPVYLDADQPYMASAKFLCHCLSMGLHLSKIFTRIQRASLFVLDDVGTRGLSAAGTEAMLDILNARGDLPMILTGNHPPLSLQKEIGDERVASRLLAGGASCWIEFPKQDQRIRA